MDEETIKQVAYRIWEERGKPDGLDFEHWLQARDEIDADNGYGLSGSVSTGVASPEAPHGTGQTIDDRADTSRGEDLK